MSKGQQDLNLLELIRDPDAFMRKKYWHGVWRGTVEDVYDPERRHRIKVRIPQLHPPQNEVPVDFLPWAETCLSDAGANCGDVHVPYRLGDEVFVIFEGSHPDFPVVMGSWFGHYREGAEIKTELPEECNNSRYPRRRIFKTRRGHKIELSDELGEMEIKVTDVKGNFIHMDTETSTLRVYWNGNKEEIVTGNSTLNIDGTYTVKVQGDRVEHITGNAALKVDGLQALDVAGDQSFNVGGNQTIGAGGDMFHLTGGTIYHNTGGSPATVDAVVRLPDPAYTVQERKPAFEKLTLQLAQVASNLGVTSSAAEAMCSGMTTACLQSPMSADMLSDGLKKVAPIVQGTVNLSSSTSAQTSLLSKATQVTEGALENAFLGSTLTTQVQGLNAKEILPEGDATLSKTSALFSLLKGLKNGASGITDSAKDIGLAMVKDSGFLAATSSTLEGAVAGKTSLLKDLVTAASKATEVKSLLNQAQSKGINVAGPLTSISSILLGLENQSTYAAALGEDIELIDKDVQSGTSTISNIVSKMSGTSGSLSSAGIGEPDYLFTLYAKSHANDPDVQDLITKMAAFSHVPESSIRSMLVYDPDAFMKLLNDFNKEGRYDEVQRASKQLDAGFGEYSNIESIVSSGILNGDELDLVQTLKNLNKNSVEDTARTLATLDHGILSSLTETLSANGYGHAGSVSAIIEATGADKLLSTASNLAAIKTSGLSENSAVSLAKNLTNSAITAGVKAVVSAVTKSSVGAYPIDDPIIKLPEGSSVKGLLDA